ncbi:N-acetylmuramoyl-L-alanine amidase [uncultured Clostridium sp.]|uniref:N-acetylmuramoyl-L-alanine amidase n=1 Tax=uncultured Clostridium sp. TaxID=59620 RepID=UPI0028E21805|nr:N-acetylmuramoyl-L-alanine amidase [uncultured Clostridium sp.]
MKKNYRRIITVFTMLLFIATGFFRGNYVGASTSFENWSTKENVEENKVWTIKFNYELNKSTINDKNIYITDEGGQTIPVNVVISSDNKGITVSLKNNAKYESGKTYYLFVNEKVQKASGKPLTKPIKMQFTIKNKEVPNNKEFAVVLDAGSGGSDTGIVGPNGNMEKDITLSIALKAGEILEKSGIKVIYTRKDDNVDWDKDDMKSRYSIVNNKDYNYFGVSIHTNTAGNVEATGVETYHLQGDLLGQKLAENIQQKVEGSIDITSRGVKPGDFPERNAANMSMAKIFVGFLNNPVEELKISTSEMQQKFAEAIAGGIIRFKETGDLNGSNGSNNIITSVEDIIHTVTEGEEFILPEKVKATSSKGQVTDEPVTWNSTTVDTSSAGTYSYVGTVAGYKDKVYLTLLVTLKGDSRHTVVIDPGHGGYDPGAVGPTGVREKDVTLAVGMEVGNILLKNGVKVVYTRTSDKVSWPSNEQKDLQKRTEIGNSVKGNYFVSIHCNSIKNNPGVNGTETYHDKDSVAGENLAQKIQSELISSLGTVDRKVKTAGFYVLKYTDAPAVLVELEFLSNPNGEKNLKDPKFQKKAAQAIANGILKSLGK